MGRLSCHSTCRAHLARTHWRPKRELPIQASYARGPLLCTGFTQDLLARSYTLERAGVNGYCMLFTGMPVEADWIAVPQAVRPSQNVLRFTTPARMARLHEALPRQGCGDSEAIKRAASSACAAISYGSA